MHHTEALKDVRAVRDALVTELKASDGEIEHYVYVELEEGATLEPVHAALGVDPLFRADRTQVFAVDSIAALEAHGSGIVLERRSTSGQGAHQSLLLEARYDAPTFAARVMLDAVRHLPTLRPGAHRYRMWS